MYFDTITTDHFTGRNLLIILFVLFYSGYIIICSLTSIYQKSSNNAQYKKAVKKLKLEKKEIKTSQKIVTLFEDNLIDFYRMCLMKPINIIKMQKENISEMYPLLAVSFFDAIENHFETEYIESRDYNIENRKYLENSLKQLKFRRKRDDDSSEDDEENQSPVAIKNEEPCNAEFYDIQTSDINGTSNKIRCINKISDLSNFSNEEGLVSDNGVPIKNKENDPSIFKLDLTKIKTSDDLSDSKSTSKTKLKALKRKNYIFLKYIIEEPLDSEIYFYKIIKNLIVKILLGLRIDIESYEKSALYFPEIKKLQEDLVLNMEEVKKNLKSLRILEYSELMKKAVTKYSNSKNEESLSSSSSDFK